MAPAQLARVVATMRRRGVRRENVRPPAALSLTLTLILTLTLTLTCAHAAHTAPKTLSTLTNNRANAHLASQVRLNTDKRLYAFNWMQQQALPEGYVPPTGSAAGGKG